MVKNLGEIVAKQVEDGVRAHLRGFADELNDHAQDLYALSRNPCFSGSPEAEAEAEDLKRKADRFSEIVKHLRQEGDK